MCRSIKSLRSLESPAPPEDVEAAALQYVRKISGYRQPSRANTAVFEQAVADISAASQRLLDGLVVARAAFHNSMNYRSVVIFGRPRIVDDPDEKLAALQAVTEHVVPGRWAASRPMTEKEMKGTLVAALPISEASAKVRSGGPEDDAEDYDLPIWAGVVPLATVPGSPIPDPDLRVDVVVPASISGYRRPSSRHS